MSKAHNILLSLYDHLATVVSDYGYTYERYNSSGNGTYAIVDHNSVGVVISKGKEIPSEFVEGTDVVANGEKQSLTYLEAPYYITATKESVATSVSDADIESHETRSNIISDLRRNYSIETSAMCQAGAISLTYIGEVDIDEDKDTQDQIKLELKLTWYEKKVV